MLYTTVNVGNKEYKCRLNAKACVDLEKRLGTNPLNIFAAIGSTNEVPKMEDMITIFHASLQCYEHSISIDDTYAIYDSFIDDGKTLMDFIPVVVDIFRVSGFFKEEGTDEKN